MYIKYKSFFLKVDAHIDRALQEYCVKELQLKTNKLAELIT
jgi:hypothetical protein